MQTPYRYLLRESRELTMRLFHITKWEQEKQKVLIPRIPESVGQWEETVSERISLAPTINLCILGFGDNCFWKYDNRIRVYSINVKEDDPDLIDWRTLYDEDRVQDAPLIQEYWYKKNIIPTDYNEQRIFDVEYGHYVIIRAKEKERLISFIEECGLSVSSEETEKSAVEILNDYSENRQMMDTFRLRFVHEELNEEYNSVSVEVCQKLGWDLPQKYIYVPDYYEKKYIVNCRTEFVSYGG